MRYRKLSPTGDYTFGNGLKNFYIDEPAAVGQAVKTRLLLWQGEWDYDTSVGTPYLDSIIGKHSQLEADATIQSETNDTQGMESIQSFESIKDSVSRSYSVTMVINTIYGPTQVQIQNYVNY